MWGQVDEDWQRLSLLDKSFAFQTDNTEETSIEVKAVETHCFPQPVDRGKVMQECDVLKMVQEACERKRKLIEIPVPDPQQKAAPCLLM